jgi:TetR/AcrR family transcriptional regulator of autoinduction and epiphytic fitness
MTPANTKVDGRTARANRTKARIAAATVELIEGGDSAPTSRRIAEQAGVSERTIFQHFADLEALHTAIAKHHIDAVSREHRLVSPTLPLPARAREFARQRGQLLEGMTALRRVALRYEADSRALQQSRLRWTALARSELMQTFGSELASAHNPAATLAAAQAVTSWAYWDELRTAEGLRPDVACRVMATALLRVLSGRP